MTSFHSHYQLLHSTGEEAGILRAFLQERFKPAFKLPHYHLATRRRKTGRKRCRIAYTRKRRAGGKELTGMFHMFLYYLNLLQNVSSYSKGGKVWHGTRFCCVMETNFKMLCKKKKKCGERVFLQTFSRFLGLNRLYIFRHHIAERCTDCIITDDQLPIKC